MTNETFRKIYRFARIAIYAIPVLAVMIGLYLILFPVDIYRYYPSDPKFSKIEVQKDIAGNNLTFGVFPIRKYRYIQLDMTLDSGRPSGCDVSAAKTILRKTYAAFLFPAGETITEEKKLRDYLFDQNQTKYPNGSLLHLKPTNEVFFITHGKKMLFPGPEIFEAFGYSFENLVDVDQSEIDQFPNAGTRDFSWTISHPDGTIFQTFPSHSFFLVFNGKKYPIADKELIDGAWPENYFVPVSDFSPDDRLMCVSGKSSNRLSCRFDSNQLTGIGRYYFFSVDFPESCRISGLNAKKLTIRFFSEKSWTTLRESAKIVAASILNRYFYKQ